MLIICQLGLDLLEIYKFLWRNKASHLQ